MKLIIIVFALLCNAVSTHPVAFNLPQLCSNASWNLSRELRLKNSAASQSFHGIFVDKNNTIYLTSEDSPKITVWSENGDLKSTFNGTLSEPRSIFVTDNGEIYIDNGKNRRVEKWTLNNKSSVTVMNVPDKCHGLFVVGENTIYCSLRNQHQVQKYNVNSLNQPKTIAGNGATGDKLDQLDKPLGIFVDRNLTLYVADYGNKRVIKFPDGQSRGTIVAKAGDSSVSSSFRPESVILDDDGNIFILDSGENGILRVTGNKSDYIIKPLLTRHNTNGQNKKWRFSFDSHGNIYTTVDEELSNRILQIPINLTLCGGSGQRTTSSTTPKSSTAASSQSPTNTTASTTPKPSTTASSQSPTNTTASITNTSLTNSNTYTNSGGVSTRFFHGHVVEQIDFDASTICSATTVVSTQSTQFKSTASISNSSYSSINPSSNLFVPKVCNQSSMIGPDCLQSSSPCDVIGSCEQYEYCSKRNQIESNPMCSCVKNISSSICESIVDPCESFLCTHGGEKKQVNGSCHCDCPPSRNGTHCELKIDFCQNLTCRNGGICFSLDDHAECQCLGKDYYSGKYCEIVATKLMIFRFISKSVSWIAIIVMVCFVSFIVIMDILKYGFGIDPVEEEREILRAERRKRQRRTPVIQRFVYVN